MGWKVRKGGDPKISLARESPDYGDNADLFTIRFYHSGLFVDVGGTTCYLDAQVSHVDYCSSDELSLIELKSMVDEIGMCEVLAYHCSKGNINDCTNTMVLRSDLDVLYMVNLCDDKKIVGVYVEHEKIIDDAEYHRRKSGGFPVVVEPLPFVGSSGVNVSLNNNTDNIGGNIGDNIGELYSELEDSDDNQSVGSDSELSEQFVDSEGDLTDSDDELFEDNVDCDVEWGGNGEACGVDPIAYRGLRATVKPTILSQKGVVFDPLKDMKNPKFELGMVFSDTNVFRKAVRQHAVICGRNICFKKNDRDKVRVRCSHKSCPWLVYASKGKKEHSLQIKTLSKRHRCPRVQKIKCANAVYVAERYEEKIWSDPRWPIESMMTVLQKELSIVFSAQQLYRAKRIVRQKGSGCEADQYGMLWNYAEEIRKTNPGSTVKIKCKLVDNEPVFKRFYVCWGALKKGFLEGCRPVIFLDGCHLKTTVGGVLLTAVGVDGNNGIYPFAYAVVEKEKSSSWKWFLELVVQDLEIASPYLWTVMSDKQKGLVDAVESVLPGCEQRHCVMHLYKNFNLAHKGLALKNLLWTAARATRVVDFQRTMQELQVRDSSAFNWLAQRPPAQWSKSHFSTHSKCELLLNNMSECFNSMILRARSRPILTMLEIIRVTLMKRLHMRRDMMVKYQGEICPKINKILEGYKKRATGFIIRWNGLDQFECEGSMGSIFKVHLGDRSCSCRRWELSGIPCPHAIAAIFHMNQLPEQFVDECYLKNKFLKSYTHMMGALDAPELWPTVSAHPLRPPPVQKLPGRPRKYARKKDVDESQAQKKSKMKGSKEKFPVKLSKKGIQMSCSQCGDHKHNKARCPLNEDTNDGMSFEDNSQPPVQDNQTKPVEINLKPQPPRRSPRKLTQTSTSANKVYEDTNDGMSFEDNSQPPVQDNQTKPVEINLKPHPPRRSPRKLTQTVTSAKTLMSPTRSAMKTIGVKRQCKVTSGSSHRSTSDNNALDLPCTQQSVSHMPNKPQPVCAIKKLKVSRRSSQVSTSGNKAHPDFATKKVVSELPTKAQPDSATEKLKLSVEVGELGYTLTNLVGKQSCVAPSGSRMHVLGDAYFSTIARERANLINKSKSKSLQM